MARVAGTKLTIELGYRIFLVGLLCTATGILIGVASLIAYIFGVWKFPIEILVFLRWPAAMLIIGVLLLASSSLLNGSDTKRKNIPTA